MNSRKFFEDFEKLKTVGQGAFGTATLYRRISDGKQVVMKEVFLMDMDNNERKAALNEVEILSTLDHPNIIKYLDSFKKDDSLIIIMEYADGGNLAQLINAKRNKNENFTEKSIINIISQICAALSYMHANKILHRDLKSANIFLNMNGKIKVGDFGISKMLNTRSQAQTVVGTPYYLSPEMCEGSDYNEKSDIWAVGCILYELACLRKPFEAMTLPVLVQKITNCEYDDIPAIYSEELSALVHSILQKNPMRRPAAVYIKESILPKIEKKNEALNSSFLSKSNTFKIGVQRERSILYKIHDFGTDQKIIPLELPHKTVVDFSVGLSHSLVVFSDHSVYTWGENKSGQLALNDISQNRTYATLVTSLSKEHIIKCAAGKNFSVFLSKNGHILTCGNGQNGCLGHGDWNSLQTPKIIDFLKNIKITQISCGDEHVIALSSEGRVFTWGSSELGQLGQGHTQYRCTPLAIKLLNLTKIKYIFCGDNESVLLTMNGQVLVAGDNKYNKLGVSGQDKITLFTPISLKERIQFVSVGSNHTLMLTENGTIIAMGRNSEGQLGKGNYIQYNNPQTVKLSNRITMVSSGLNFSVAVDNKNVVWFWGSFYKSCKNSFDQQKNMRSNAVLPFVNQEQTVIIKDFGFEENIEEVAIESVKVPRSILAFYSSRNNIKTGNVIYAAGIKVKSNYLFLLAHTTSPAPVKEFTNRDVVHHDYMSQFEDTTKAPSTSINLPKII